MIRKAYFRGKKRCFSEIFQGLYSWNSQGWLSYIIRSFLQVGFRFQYQLINLAWLSIDFFSFSWSLTICFFVASYSCVCSFPKTSRNIFCLYSFCNQPVLFAKLENVNKLSNNNRTAHVNKRNQNKSKTKHVIFKYFKSAVIVYSIWKFKFLHKYKSNNIRN